VGLITGGGTGIGFGIAELLAGLGMHVVLASRRVEHLDPAVKRIRARGGAASAVPVDVRDRARVAAMVARVAGGLGRIDLLVNNAAGNFYAPSEVMSENAWRAVVEIDLYGTFFCAQAVVPLMREAGGGRIVNVSMTLHYRGWPQMAHATAAKGGIDALTRTLAVEWAPYGIRVNVVAPGPVPTEGVLRAFAHPNSGAGDVFATQRSGAGESAGSADGRVSDVVPLGRWGTPHDIAQMVAYLASPAGDWITGAIFVVDGGEWLRQARR
jgi:peroxisomal 2,4-dienoyl-CoA reductase